MPLTVCCCDAPELARLRRGTGAKRGPRSPVGNREPRGNHPPGLPGPESPRMVPSAGLAAVPALAVSGGTCGCIYAGAYGCECVCTHTCACACLHLCARSCVLVCVYACVHTRVCACACTHVHVCACMHTQGAVLPLPGTDLPRFCASQPRGGCHPPTVGASPTGGARLSWQPPWLSRECRALPGWGEGTRGGCAHHWTPRSVKLLSSE